MSDLPFDDQTDFDHAERGATVRLALSNGLLDTPDPAFPIVTP